MIRKSGRIIPIRRYPATFEYKDKNEVWHIMKTAKQWKDCYASQEFQERYTYDGTDLGMTCTEEGTSFLLWSPFAEAVTLNLYGDGGDSPANQQIPMRKEKRGVWVYRTTEFLHGVYYDYELVIEGEKRISADPYAKACGINGKRSMVIDLRKTDPDGWLEDQPPAPQKETIVYELHVKEFSWDQAGGFPEESRGKYRAFLCEDTTLEGKGVHPTGIPYLKELGVTHVQLMPVYDYGSVDEAGQPDAFNWGYDPVNYNVPEGSYATDASRGEVRVRELKEMIQSLHRNGFRVIMDVVYNHTYSLDSWFQRVVPWYYYRVHEDGRPANGSACGNDVASERPMCGNYILQSVLYWAEEYHMDGFRFDLMGLLDVELMNRIRAALDERYGKGEKILYGEPWAAAETAMENGAVQALKINVGQLDENIGIFCDNTRDAVKGSVFERKEPGFVNGGTGLEDAVLNSVQAWCKTQRKELGIKAPSQVVTYVSAHDNQTLWDKLTDTVLDEELRKSVYRLAAGVYMTCQGNLFFLSGEEFARTKDGEDNTYNAPIRLNRLDWRKAWQEEKLVTYYRGLIALRKHLPGLCDKSADAGKRIFGQWKEEGIVGFLVDNRSEEEVVLWETLMIVYNSRMTGAKIVLPKGEWEVLADAENTFRWQHPQAVAEHVQAAPVSVLILGKRRN